MKKVVILGHSYVRDLSGVGDKVRKFANGIEYKIYYFHIPGSRFDHWMNFPEKLHDLIELVPDFVLVYLGGNSIVNSVSDADLKHNAKVFFKILRNSLSNVIIIAAQIELRFVCESNTHGTPTIETFKKRRNRYNYFLRTVKGINFLAQIAGPGRLDNKTFYRRDGVHLNSDGLSYLDFLLNNAIVYAYEHSNRS